MLHYFNTDMPVVAVDLKVHFNCLCRRERKLFACIFLMCHFLPLNGQCSTRTLYDNCVSDQFLNQMVLSRLLCAPQSKLGTSAHCSLLLRSNCQNCIEIVFKYFDLDFFFFFGRDKLLFCFFFKRILLALWAPLEQNNSSSLEFR